MDFSPSLDEQLFISSVESLLSDHQELPQNSRSKAYYFDSRLQFELKNQGYLDAAIELGPVAGALLVMATARLSPVVEVGASALVRPMVVPKQPLEGPIALIDLSEPRRTYRFLPVAASALLVKGDDIEVMRVAPVQVEEVDSILAYPYGKFVNPREISSRCLVPGGASRLRQWWRVAISAELAGAADAAVDFTVQFAKEREVLGRPIGSFQAVQHRLSQCRQIANGMRWLTLRAAWSGEVKDANLAACYAQQQVGKLVFDLHQFNGAMGVTNEHLLHFWTYRLRALQNEVGGAYSAALDVADSLWSDEEESSRDANDLIFDVMS